jgi:hypothetical protein
MDRIQKYIVHNPVQWEEDRDNPMGPGFFLPAKSIDDYWNEIFDFHM